MSTKASSPQRRVVLLVRGRGTWTRRASVLLQSAGFVVHQAFSAKDARDALFCGKVSFVISDMYLRDQTGFRFIRRAREISPNTAVCLACSHSLAIKHSRMLASWLARSNRPGLAKILRPLFGR